MANGKPQRRTLVKALTELVERVNQDVFAVRSVSEVENELRPLLRTMNAAEQLLDRERQHNLAAEHKAERKQTSVR